MGQVHLLFANKSYDTSKQVLTENQMVIGYGYAMSEERYVVYRVEENAYGFSYHLININTKEFAQTDLPRPLREVFGIGYYYNDETLEFMDSFEVAILHSEAEKIAQEEQTEKQKQQERNEELKVIGKERLQSLIPADTKAVIVAELHKNESDSMTDYFGYSTIRTVILGFSTHTKDLFAEMRKHAANFEETAHLTEVNEEYENREKYTGGAGYYLGESRYSGWVVKKVKYYKDRESIIDAFALVAGEESNIYVKAQQATTNATPTAITGDFVIVDYSLKALALFGNTRPIKDQLQALGGRFNPKLMHNEKKQAGWIFSKSKEQELKNLLTIK
jgi:hypothetical protein